LHDLGCEQSVVAPIRSEASHETPFLKEEFVGALGSERTRAASKQAQAPLLVVLTAPLDGERVRRFAAGNRVERVKQFVAAI
jgi:hypothetical protein